MGVQTKRWTLGTQIGASRVRAMSVGTTRVRISSIDASRVRIRSIQGPFSPPDGHSPHPGFADGRNANPGCGGDSKRGRGGSPARAKPDPADAPDRRLQQLELGRQTIREPPPAALTSYTAARRPYRIAKGRHPMQHWPRPQTESRTRDARAASNRAQVPGTASTRARRHPGRVRQPGPRPRSPGATIACSIDPITCSINPVPKLRPALTPSPN